MIFGKPKGSTGTMTQLKMLDGHTPQFTAFSGNLYDSDLVRSSVDAVARNAAKLKPRHIRRSGGEMSRMDSTLDTLLSVRPNPHMDAYSFYYKIVTQLYINNNAFVYIDWGKDGAIKAFYPINSMQTQLLEAGGEVFVKFNFLGGQVVTLPYAEIIHLRRFFNSSDFFGDQSSAAILPTMDLVNSTNQGIVNAIKSSSFLRGLLKFTSMLKAEDMKKQRDLFVADYLDINANGGVAATDAKAEYVPLDSNPKMIDAEMMTRIEDKVYKYYNVNPAIIRSDYTETQWNAFYESVLEPIALQLSLEFTAKVFSARERGFGNEIVFEANRLQYASTTTKVNVVGALIDRGIISINEAREVFNLASVEGGDKRIVSLNYVDASVANQYQLGGAPDGKADAGV
jgi:HK97 family phage portal protein